MGGFTLVELTKDPTTNGGQSEGRITCPHLHGRCRPSAVGVSTLALGLEKIRLHEKSGKEWEVEGWVAVQYR